jgi:hypothetical protein
MSFPTRFDVNRRFVAVPLVPVLSHINPASTFITYLFRMSLNINFLSYGSQVVLRLKFCIFRLRPACLTHLNVGVGTRVILRNEDESLSPSVCIFLRHPVTSFFRSPIVCNSVQIFMEGHDPMKRIMLKEQGQRTGLAPLCPRRHIAHKRNECLKCVEEVTPKLRIPKCFKSNPG